MRTIFILLLSILALPSRANDRTIIERHLQEKYDRKAMQHILLELEDKDEKEIDTFINLFIDICTQQEREYLKNQVIMRLYVATTPKQPTGELLEVMRSFGVLLGDQAPDFAINDSTKLYDVLGEKTVLFFYEHSCTLCHEELNQLRLNYSILQEKGIQVISIDCNVEETSSQKWEYNIVDPLGQVYFPYGILSTPTFIVLDAEGKIVGRYNRYNTIEEIK